MLTGSVGNMTITRLERRKRAISKTILSNERNYQKGTAMMKIVILDGHAVNPGDLSWAPIQALGQVTVYDYTRPEDTAAHIGDASVVLTNKTLITRQILDACPGIRYIGVLATGYNVVDLEAASERGIPVTNIPAYSTRTVAQFTFALLLELCHHVGLHDASVKAGDWIRSTDFCYWKTPALELDGLTMGIVGFGQIGRKVASIARSFGMDLLVSTPHPRPELECEDLHFVSLETLLAQSDVVSLHCPLTASTQHLINRVTLGLMKPGSLLINVSRGGLVDEPALREALQSGHLSGAACDVISAEPMEPDNPLLTAPNILLTPHIAWSSVAARTRLVKIAAANIRGWMDGTPQNRVG